jgi:hypothetical protein
MASDADADVTGCAAHGKKEKTQEQAIVCIAGDRPLQLMVFLSLIIVNFIPDIYTYRIMLQRASILCFFSVFF